MPDERRFTAHPEKRDAAYAPSFDLDGALLTEHHGSIHADVADIEGWLAPEDSLKLYELGFLAPGPYLEIGTYRGKSTTVLATALRDAGRDVEFYSLEIGRVWLESARATLAARGLGRQVALVHGSVTAFFRAFPDFRPGFVFADGDHSLAGLERDLAALEPRVPEGGLLLFHDFLDGRNEDPNNRDYAVPQAIEGSWVRRDCEFAGSFGCAALYRRVRGPSTVEGDARAPAVVQLLPLDRPALRLKVRVVTPARDAVRGLLRRGS